MSSAGHIIDAINRIKQNRALRASKRQKFKGSNRESIYSGADQTQKAVFKKVPKEQAQAVINKIRHEFKIKRKRDIIYLTTFTLIIASIIIKLNISENNTLKNENAVKFFETKPIQWNGNISEPLKIKNTNYYYIPILHGISGELDEHGFYNLKDNNMVGERTRNILFMDKECTVIGKLLDKDGFIDYMEVISSNDNDVPTNIFYILSEEDSNEDEMIDTKDRYAYYISDLNGQNLLKITDKPLVSIKLRKENLIFEYHITKNSTDSIYGVYNMPNKKLKFTNQLDSIN